MAKTRSRNARSSSRTSSTPTAGSTSRRWTACRRRGQPLDPAPTQLDDAQGWIPICSWTPPLAGGSRHARFSTRRAEAGSRLPPPDPRVGARARRGAPGLRGRTASFTAAARTACPRVVRVPLLSGRRLVVVEAGENDFAIRPPPPVEKIADVGAAVREALRFPLAGVPWRRSSPRRRATVVVEPPSLPIPAPSADPRQDAIAATMAELAERRSAVGASDDARGRRARAGGSVPAGAREPRPPRVRRRFPASSRCTTPSEPDLVDLGTGRPRRAAPGQSGARRDGPGPRGQRRRVGAPRWSRRALLAASEPGAPCVRPRPTRCSRRRLRADGSSRIALERELSPPGAARRRLPVR